LVHGAVMICPILSDQVKEIVFTGLHGKGDPHEYRGVLCTATAFGDTLIQQWDRLGAIQGSRLDCPIDGGIRHSKCGQVLVGVIGGEIATLSGTDALIEQLFQQSGKRSKTQLSQTGIS
jgi:hypothetical protein